MERPDTIESKVSETVLERASEIIVVGGNEYPLAPPTLATIIMTSELVATLPPVNFDNDNLISEVFINAKHGRTIARIVATLLLGAKRVLENRKVVDDVYSPKVGFFKRLWQRITKRNKERMVLEIDHLTQIILNEISPSTLQLILHRRLVDMQITDFFAITTSLTTANHIKPTVEVENPTQSGE
jgi:hypothetical protein